MTAGVAEQQGVVPAKSSAWTDLGLTLPIFVVYHLGVMFLPVRNAADVVTQELVALAHNDRISYAALTVGLGALFVAVLLMLGRGDKLLKWQSFAWLALEGIVYAVAMKLVAAAVIGELFLAAGIEGRFTGFIMSLGAGLYEEVAFRVVLFGLGLSCLRVLLKPKSLFQRWSLAIGWALLSAIVFSAWHHMGSYGESLDARVFVFRVVCALVFIVIYVTRGFAPVVWTHVAYDVWVLAF
ncbi:MAG TPA: CPBP family glutamic-type intramembrane protease [Polyangiaceae bacterium]|nr:CPBP family glutamic-type intramembrane protease [Polyangiaceae bacterium]